VNSEKLKVKSAGASQLFTFHYSLFTLNKIS
jgi:hypothetical protein